jgi:GNAT superfamily N-acetyltransferase
MRICKFIPTKENWKKIRAFYNSLTIEKETFQDDSTINGWPVFPKARFLIVAMSSGKIIGVAGLKKNSYTFTVIKKEFQGQGLGQMMFKIRRREIDKLGIKKIRSKTFNPVALHILKKEGYRELYTLKTVKADETIKVEYYLELPLSNMTRFTFPFRKIIYVLYKFWRSWFTFHFRKIGSILYTKFWKSWH